MVTKMHGGVEIRHEHFGSVSALVDWVKQIDEQHRHVRTGYELAAGRGLRYAQDGDVTLVAQAQALIDRFQEEIPTLRRVWQPAVAGFFPNVPAFLAGEPESMWHIANEESDRAPIRIWVGVGSSSGVNNAELVQRGAVLAAFAMALAERRPVVITPYWQLGKMAGGLRGLLVSWDLQTSPLVLSEVMACLANPDVIRNLALDTMFRAESRWPQVGHWAPNGFTEQKMREYLGCEDADIWLPAIHLSDALLSDPMTWIKREIAKHISEEIE